jgi:putative transposase
MLPRRPERLKGFDYLGQNAYFLTYCTDQRHSAFLDRAHVEVACTQILRAAVDEKFAVVAYCFMPDHLHLLASGEREDSDGRAFIKRSKQFSGFYYQKAFGRRLWQPYGYEHVLRGDEGLLSVARYIVENPVRARIVKSASDYPFTGSPLYSIEQILDSLPWAGTGDTRGRSA